MLSQYKETGTTASRVIYINSKDATAIMGDNRSDFDFTLEEPIVVPNHHNILLSVYSAEIPYSFYNFRNGVNCKLDYPSPPESIFISSCLPRISSDSRGFMH